MKDQIASPLHGHALDFSKYGNDWGSVMEHTTRIIALSRVKRHRFADRKGSFHHFRVEQLIINLIKAAISSVQRFIEPMLTADPNADLGLVLSKVNWTAATATLIRDARYFFAKSYLNLSLQRFIEHVLIQYGHEKLAGKLIKNTSLSAIRKAERFGRMEAARLMVFTTAYATCLPIATMVVIDSISAIIEECQKLKTDKATKLKNIQKRVTAVCTLYATTFGFTVVGHALGTMVYPGTGTSLVGMLFELAPSLLLN